MYILGQDIEKLEKLLTYIYIYIYMVFGRYLESRE